MMGKSLSEEEPVEENASGQDSKPEYAFEGFEIEFSEKIMLTPLATIQRGKQKSGPMP